MLENWILDVNLIRQDINQFLLLQGLFDFPVCASPFDAPNTALAVTEITVVLVTVYICSRFPEIIFAQNSGIIEVSKEAKESQPLHVQSDSLKAIGILLYKSIGFLRP